MSSNAVARLLRPSELFSPDAATLAGQIAQADKMRFSFSPFNSVPVTAQSRRARLCLFARDRHQNLPQ